KKIGILYVLMALVFLIIGGIEALLIRCQLLWPRNDLLGPDRFNQLFTMHGTTMVFFVAIPILIPIATYLLPLIIITLHLPSPRSTPWPSVNPGSAAWSSTSAPPPAAPRPSAGSPTRR